MVQNKYFHSLEACWVRSLAGSQCAFTAELYRYRRYSREYWKPTPCVCGLQTLPLLREFFAVHCLSAMLDAARDVAASDSCVVRLGLDGGPKRGLWASHVLGGLAWYWLLLPIKRIETTSEVEGSQQREKERNNNNAGDRAATAASPGSPERRRMGGRTRVDYFGMPRAGRGRHASGH